MLRNLPSWLRVLMCFAVFVLVILYFTIVESLTDPPLWIRLIFSLLALVYTLAFTIGCLSLVYRILMWFGSVLARWIKDEFL
jgi:hypothetical protein